MDRRLLASNGRVADKALEGQIEAQDFVTPVRHQLIRNAWLTRDPNGVVDRE